MQIINGIYFKNRQSSFLKCISQGFKESNPDCFYKNFISVISDSIIYNRRELFLRIDCSEYLAENCSDAELISQIYIKFGYDAADMIDGDFSFVLWDEKKQELFCCRSKTGRKPLYYHDSESCFAFSTLFKSFFRCFSVSLELNDQYIADFLTINGKRNEIDPYHTIYRGINQLPPGFCLSIKDGKTKLWQYWKLEKKDEIILKDDEEYESALIDILNQGIQKRIKNRENIGLLLSAGFDSGIIAGLTSKQLRNKKSRLTTFTSVPISTYQNWLPKNRIADESIYMCEYQQMYDNIDMNFLSYENRNSYLDIDEYIKIFEQPYKFFENSFWIIESVKLASKKNIDVLFSGQLGNGTISWGSFYPYLIYLLRQHKYRNLFQEVGDYAYLKNEKVTTVLRRLFFKISHPNLKKIILKLFNRNSLISEYLPVNKEFVNFKKEDKRFRSLGWDNDFLTVLDSLGVRLHMLGPGGFSHRGANKTKLGLKYNVSFADPTDDVELIEFCLNLPEDQFVRNGIERRLIKRTVKGYIPDKILNSNVRGKQSADWVQRIKPYWLIIKEELLSIGDYQLEKKYLDRTIIQKNIDMLKDFDFIRGDNLHMRILFRTLIFSRFLRMVEKGTLFDD